MDSKMQLTLEAVSCVDHKIDSVRDELKEDIAVLDCKMMGLSKRVDTLDQKIDAVDKKVDAVNKKLSAKIDAVDKKLSEKIDAVHEELIAHRTDTELHRSQPKRTLKRVI
jgi:archaellum component FlaC